MKATALVIGLMISSMSFAGEIKVLDIPVSFGRDSVSASIALSKTTGKAYVNLDVTDMGDIEGSTETIRTEVNGLSHDKNTDMVVLNTEAGSIECATVSYGHFGRIKVRLTDACSFETRKVTVLEDNGYEIKKVKRVQTYLKY